MVRAALGAIVGVGVGLDFLAGYRSASVGADEIVAYLLPAAGATKDHYFVELPVLCCR